MELLEACSRLRDSKRTFGTISMAVEVLTPLSSVRVELHDGLMSAVGTPTGAADLVLTSTADAKVDQARSTLPVRRSTHEASVDEARMWLVSGPGCEPCLVPPLDQLSTDWAIGLPPLPGVDVCWTTLFLDTPFGDLPMTFHVEDGQLRRVEPIWDDGAEVWFKFNIRRSLGARSGQFTIPETLDDGGGCSGDIDALMLVAGLQETDEWVAARWIGVERFGVLSAFLDLHDLQFFTALHAELG